MKKGIFHWEILINIVFTIGKNVILYWENSIYLTHKIINSKNKSYGKKSKSKSKS